MISPAPSLAAFERRWRDQRRARRNRTLFCGSLFAAAFAVSAWVGEFRVDRFVEGAPALWSYVEATLPPMSLRTLPSDLAGWYWDVGRWLGLLLDTVVIAFLGTVMGAVGAFALCFVASRNLSRSRAACVLARRLLEIARGVPELVYAMILVFAFGIGPFAGVLAFAIHSMGALGKLFSEVNENADMRPVEGLAAAGAGWFQSMRYAVVPQVLPAYTSYALLRFEINVRSASIIGFVGAGGIGQELMFVIRQFIYVDVSAIVLMIVATVAVIDVACEHLRHRLLRAGLAL